MPLIKEIISYDENVNYVNYLHYLLSSQGQLRAKHLIQLGLSFSDFYFTLNLLNSAHALYTQVKHILR